MTPASDPDLVRRCLAGEEDAWRLLTARYADVVYGVARRCGLGGEDAGDVVQETFVALWRGLSRLRRAERLLAWVLKTARREAWRQVRRLRAAHRRDGKAARPELAEGPLPDEVLALLERQQAVREAFAGLEERCRRLLDALFFEPTPRPYGEIATSLGMAVGSIGPTRKRCLEALRTLLEAQDFRAPEVSDAPRSASGGVTRKRP